jgi:hypothetical protein
MIRSRLGLRAIGLCLAIAGLMAVGAGSAQAEVGSFWLVSGLKVTTLLPELTGALENNHGVILAEIGGTGIHILCTALAFVAGNHLLAEGGWLGKVRLSGCIVRLLKVLNSAASLVTLGPCAPPGGIIETTTLKGLIRLHKLADGTLHPIKVVEPNVGTLFASFVTSEECAFGEKIEFGGKLAFKDCKNAFLTDQVEHLFEEFAPLTALYLNNNVNNKATLHGSVNVKLAGAHAGLTWAGHSA